MVSGWSDLAADVVETRHVDLPDLSAVAPEKMFGINL
jgi:hypothetical protein